jgi:WXG100 family type VII secretion target
MLRQGFESPTRDSDKAMEPGYGTSFHVDPTALDSIIGLLSDFEKRSEEFVAEVERHVEALHVDWEGVTAAAHLEAQAKWAAGAAEMQKAVGELRAIVKQAHQNYGSAASANTSMWQR